LFAIKPVALIELKIEKSPRFARVLDLVLEGNGDDRSRSFEKLEVLAGQIGGVGDFVDQMSQVLAGLAVQYIAYPHWASFFPEKGPNSFAFL
jgi:hypothetical protein